MSKDFIVLGKHSFIYFLANVIPSAFSFVTLFIYTRLLHPAFYGVYCLIFSTALLGISISIGGMGPSIVRFWPSMSDENEKEKFLSTLYCFALTIIFLLSVVFSIILTFFYLKYKDGIIFWGIGIFVTQSLVQMNLDYLRADIKPASYGMMNCAKAFFTLAIGASLLIAGYGLSGALAGIVIANIMVLLLFLRFNRQWLKIKFRAFDKIVFKQIFSFSMPMSFSFALRYIISNSDKWLIAGLLSMKQSGLYAAAYNLPLYCLTVIMTVVNLAAYPLIVKLYESEGVGAATRQLNKQLLLFLALVVPACLGFLILDNNIVSFALGEQFRSTALLLMPLIIIAVFISGIKAYYFDLSFHIAKRTMTLFWVSLVVAISNIILNLCLIPVFGIIGSALASIIAFSIGLSASIFFGRKYFKMPFKVKYFWQIIVAALVMSGVLCLIKNWYGGISLFVQMIIGVIVYLLVLATINYNNSFRLLSIIKSHGIENEKIA